MLNPPLAESTFNILLPAVFGVLGTALGASLGSIIPWVHESKTESARDRTCIRLVISELRTNKDRAEFRSRDRTGYRDEVALLRLIPHIGMEFDVGEWNASRGRLAQYLPAELWQIIDEQNRGLEQLDRFVAHYTFDLDAEVRPEDREHQASEEEMADLYSTTRASTAEAADSLSTLLDILSHFDEDKPKQTLEKAVSASRRSAPAK